MKKLLVFMLMMVVCGAEAKRAMPTAEDRAQMERATEILWRESELTENEMKTLGELVGHPFSDVSAYAFCVAVVRTANDSAKWHDVCRKALGLGESSETRRIAEIIKDIDGELTVKKLVKRLQKRSKAIDESKLKHRHKDSLGYCHDILAYFLIREARREGRPAVIPPDVRFDVLQKELLEYAFKPEQEAWEYLYVKFEELAPWDFDAKDLYKKNLEKRAVVSALAAYSKVFFDEAVAIMKSEATSDVAMDILFDYWLRIRGRLDTERNEQFKKLLRRREILQGNVTTVLWREAELTEDDIQMLRDIMRSPFDRTSAYALSAFIVRCAERPDMLRKEAEELLKCPMKYKSVTRRMAEYVVEVGGRITIGSLTEKLEHEHGMDIDENPDTRFRDALMYFLIRDARREGKAVVVPQHVKFNGYQKSLFEYAIKPEKEAWDFLYPKFMELRNEGIYADHFVRAALKAYSVVFFDSATAVIRTQNVDQRIKEEVALYLLDNFMRLNDEQRTELWNLLDTWKLFDRQRSFGLW